MKTQVEIRLVIEHEDDDKYQNIMDDIESEIKSISGVESVDVGIGEDYE